MTNYIDNVTKSIEFEGDCRQSAFQRTKVFYNQLHSACYGLYMYSGAKIDDQGNNAYAYIDSHGNVINVPESASENYWFGPYPAQGFKTFVDNVSATNNVNSYSRFFVRNGNPTNPNTSAQNGSFLSSPAYSYNVGIYPVGGVPAYVYSVNCNGNFPGIATEGDGNFDDSVTAIRTMLTDSNASEDFGDVMQWMMKKFAYQQLKDSINLKDQDTTLSSFYDTTFYANIGKIVEIENKLQLGDKQGANTDNNNFIPTNLMENNKKIITYLLLQPELDSNYVYTSSDSILAYSVASQCFNLGGDAVLQARALYDFIIDDIATFSDSCLIKDKHLINHHTTNLPPVVNDSFVLFPNPNDGNMTLSYRLSDGENGELSIYDIAGKLISKHRFISGNSSINIDETQLNAGAYFYEIKANDRKIKTDKLIILKQ